MARDAFDPGMNNAYPNFPRRPSTGAPLWSDSAESDGVRIEGVTPMPRGLRRGPGGMSLDVTPRRSDGTPITPPVLP